MEECGKNSRASVGEGEIDRGGCSPASEGDAAYFHLRQGMFPLLSGPGGAQSIYLQFVLHRSEANVFVQLVQPPAGQARVGEELRIGFAVGSVEVAAGQGREAASGFVAVNYAVIPKLIPTSNLILLHNYMQFYIHCCSIVY